MAEVTWIRGHIDPSKPGEYYVILEAKRDVLDYRKGDMEITTDYFRDSGYGWESIGKDNPTWEVVAWARILHPNIPEHCRDKVIRYFGVDVKKGG